MEQVYHVEFRPDRLNQVAEYLLRSNAKPNIQAIEEVPKLFWIDGKLTGSIPVFIGPITKFPSIFANEWFKTEQGEYYWKGDKRKKTLSSFLMFFGIGLEQFGHLMIPGAQVCTLYGGIMLKNNSSSKDVGQNIISFINSQKLSLDLIEQINIFISKN